MVAAIAGGAWAQNKQNKKSRSKKATATHIRTQMPDTAGMAAANIWADQKMKHLSIEEKVGQLMFVRVPLTMTKKQQREFERNFLQRHRCHTAGTYPPLPEAQSPPTHGYHRR